MNRSIALFVALVILLAHILAIHNDGEGNFAFPYDQAYVVFRLARHLVREGELAWNLGFGGFESYPSSLWVAIASIGERLSYPVFLFCQATGVLATLFTVILLAQFRPERTASLIAPLLLVTSGIVAAGAANGLESGVFVLFATASFWSFERGLALRLALALTLLCLVRHEGLVFVGALFAIRLFERRTRPEATRSERALWPFLAPVAALTVAALVRARATGLLLPPTAYALLDPEPGQWRDGLVYLGDFVRVSVDALLVAYPLWFLLRRRLSRSGTHALVLAAAWTVLVVLGGRSPLPFAEGMLPALPFLFLAIQEGLTEVLDGVSTLQRKVAIGLLFAGIAGTALASKTPGNLGPLQTERWHARWMESSGSARFGYEQPLGRLGVDEEIARTNRLRAVGLFLRDHVAVVDPTYSVLSPWPGSIGYLSNMQVWDMLGRTNAVPGRDAPASWTRRERADVVAVLAREPGFDYLVPLLEPEASAPTIEEIAARWRAELDRAPAGQAPAEREARIAAALADYELIAVPIYGFNRGPVPPKGQSFYLLRHRRLAQRPELGLELDEHGYRVLVRHKSHQQLVDLSVTLHDELGRRWHLRPNGALVAAPVHARTSILVYNTGSRSVELVRGALPAEVEGSRVVAIEAVLHNPGCGEGHGFAATSDVVRVAL